MTPLSNPSELHQVRQITGGYTENRASLAAASVIRVTSTGQSLA